MFKHVLCRRHGNRAHKTVEQISSRFAQTSSSSASTNQIPKTFNQSEFLWQQKRGKHEQPEQKTKDQRCQHDWQKPFHASPLPIDAAGGLLEYSVVYTDRALNHMSRPFQEIMKNLNQTLKEAYNATSVVIMPGSGTYGMEAVARQWCTGKKALVLRNGYFSYRWTDIFEQTGIPSETIVMRGVPVDAENKQPYFQPPPIEEVVKTIMTEKPAVVFAPHVETSTGIILPDDYIKKVATAVHAHGGLFVLDCIASGHIWVDMKETGVDAILSAPQKGWTGPACSSVIMLGERGTHATRNTTSTSMVINMRKWLEVMDSYVNGGFAYYTTMPTDALSLFNAAAKETQKIGFAEVKKMAWTLGMETRKMMESKGLKSVAAPGFQAPGVVVSYTPEPNMFNIFKGKGMQIAAGVPFMINEPAGNFTFRIGLFGLDKVVNKQRTIDILEDKLDEILPEIEKEQAEKLA
jgi:alanine-glyoxylate transaminase/serine-glyoxylate transaminase/serine-pyruvate transaminase